MKVLHTPIWRRLLGPIEDRIREVGLDVELVPLGSGPGTVLLAGGSLSEEDFALAREAGVEWVQMLTVGMEDVTPAIAGTPVVLTTVGGVGVDAIAEFVFARILEDAKELRRLAELQSARAWEMPVLGELAGATITVVGLGPIGERVAELGRAFRMHVVGVRRRPEVGSTWCDEVAGPDELREILPRTDVLVIAAPQTPDTEGLLGSEALDAIQEGALVVNVGRGPLVDEDALLDALRAGRVRAALDVFGEEPLPEDSPLWDAPGLAASPHCASITPGLFAQLADIAVENLRRHLAGEPLENVVDKDAWYPVRQAPSGRG